MTSDAFYIGDWLIAPELNRISRTGCAQQIEPRLMQLLVLLADNPDKMMKKSHIMETVWDGVTVTEESLSQAISKLRRVLEDEPEAPLYIETIRAKGYRLIATVTGAKKAPDYAKIGQRVVLAAAALTIFISYLHFDYVH